MTAALRVMAPADLTAVTELERDLFPEDAWSWEMFASEISGHAYGRYYLVAEEAGRIVGYAGLLAQPLAASRRPDLPATGQADVLTMAVATSHWGQGIGSALLTALLDEATRHGCTEVFLEVRADNPRAQRLYRRHGFAAAGLRRGYYQPSGVDAIVMRRPAGQGQPVPAAGNSPEAAGQVPGKDGP
jgi:ribosomal-protein-alanine N-acetyltransferase